MEVVIAIFLTTLAVLAVMSISRRRGRPAGRSDYLGRAAGSCMRNCSGRRPSIMNPCNAVTTGTTGPTVVFASGQTTAQPGDAQFNLTTTITSVATNVWRVTVRVAWTGHPGISESLIVTRQEGYRFPAGCTSQ